MKMNDAWRSAVQETVELAGGATWMRVCVGGKTFGIVEHKDGVVLTQANRRGPVETPQMLLDSPDSCRWVDPDSLDECYIVDGIPYLTPFSCC